MEDLAERAAREDSILVASLMLCSEHADAFKPPITWTFTDNRAQASNQADDQADDQTIRRAGLSLAHSETMKDGRDEAESNAGQSAIPLVRAEDMEDTPLLQRAFRSISG